MACKSLSLITEPCLNRYVVLNPFFYIKKINRKTILTTRKQSGFQYSISHFIFNICFKPFPTHIYLVLILLRCIKQKTALFDNQHTAP